MARHPSLSREEIKDFHKLSDARGWAAVLTTWGIIAASLALVALYPTPWTLLVALILLGGRFLALGILMHDASHHSLFKTPWLNDFVGEWICAAPGFQDLRRYRKHHLAHHRLAGTEKDPDMSLISSFPITRRSLIRKITRDLTGITGLKRLYGIALMDLGFAHYTVAADLRMTTSKERVTTVTFRNALTNLSPSIFTHILLFLVLVALGHAWLYGIWALAYLTTFSLFIRIRSIAEHACTGTGLSPIQNTRTTLASPLARFTVAPHRVNYHLEHHLFMAVPSFKLPALHKILSQRGISRNAHLAKNYIEVLRVATNT